MLSEASIREIIQQLPGMRIAVVGDFFLDRYFHIEADLNEPSLETGLDAYQVTDVRNSPGAGGTVVNNLAGLGVGHISVLTVVGRDGEGFELTRQLEARGANTEHLLEADGRRTPTYMKPMYRQAGVPARELNRLDIKNRQPAGALLVREIAQRLDAVFADHKGVIIADQVSEPECGVITLAIRERIAELAARYADRIVLADSRERIGLFRNVIAKPNRAECLKAVSAGQGESCLVEAAQLLARKTRRPLYCTMGSEGSLYVDSERTTQIAPFPVHGPLDIVGAGDSATAGIVTALYSGADPVQAGAFGNLIASITVQQIGTTGYATPEQVMERWNHVSR